MNTAKKNNLEYCIVAGNTDVGLVRKANEDNLDFFDCENGRVVVVCDGMGGHVGGAVASKTAIDAIRAFLTKNYFSDPQQGIVEALNEANKAILEKTYSDPALQGMGSTGVVLIIRNGKVYYGSIGDSRIYIIRDRKITRLTKDESYVQMLVDAGMNPEEAEHHPRKNEITNALGLQGMTPAKTGMIDDPHAGDSFLLCSDGLTGMVPEAIISKVVSDKSVPLQQRVDKLIDLAKRGGGVDNITVQIVEFVIDPSALTSPDKKSTILKTAVIGVLAAVILGIGGWYLFLRNKDKGEEREKTAYQLPGLKLIPGEKSIKLFSIITIGDSTKLQFNKEYFKNTRDYTIGERIPRDSIKLSKKLFITSTQDSMKCGIDVPEKVNEFPDELKIIFLGEKAVHIITCELKVQPLDSKQQIKKDINGEPTYIEDGKNVTANKREQKRQDPAISNPLTSLTYQTSCKTIIITAASSISASTDNDTFSITTNFELIPEDKMTSGYSIDFETNSDNIFKKATITITSSVNETIKVMGRKGKLIIDYTPSDTVDVEEAAEHSQDEHNTELKTYDI